LNVFDNKRGSAMERWLEMLLVNGCGVDGSHIALAFAFGVRPEIIALMLADGMVNCYSFPDEIQESYGLAVRSRESRGLEPAAGDASDVGGTRRRATHATRSDGGASGDLPRFDRCRYGLLHAAFGDEPARRALSARVRRRPVRQSFCVF
jgi:hypothetical protein